MENINIKKKEEEEEEKNFVSFVSPGEIVGGGSLGCDGCGPTECFRVTHKSSSGPYLCTHTHRHTRERRRKENEGRKNELSRISLADDGRVTGEREKNNHQHTFPP